MKSVFIWFSLFLWFSGLVAAQQAVDTTVSALPLPEGNMILALKGIMPGNLPADFTFVISGPSLQVKQKLGEMEFNGTQQPILGDFTVTLSKMGDSYRAIYLVGVSVPTLANGHVTYHVASATGTVILQNAKPVVVLNNDGKTLAISLAKANP